MKIIYVLTGEKRCPEGGEWFLHPELGPIQAKEHYSEEKHWILERQEVDEKE